MAFIYLQHLSYVLTLWSCCGQHMSDINKINGFSHQLLITGLPEGQKLGLPASELFFSTPPSPSCASQALLSTWLSLLIGEETIKVLLQVIWNFTAKLQAHTALLLPPSSLILEKKLLAKILDTTRQLVFMSALNM